MPERKLRTLGIGLGLAIALIVSASLALAVNQEQGQGKLGKLRTEVALRLALLRSLGTDGLRIGVEVADGTVTLSGEVKKRSSQELAKEVALSVDGVTSVKDNLRYAAEQRGEPVGETIGDLEGELADGVLESRVKLALLDTVGAAALDIEVEATDQVVSLRGTVPDGRQRSLAVDTAKKTEGVQRVIDLLSGS